MAERAAELAANREPVFVATRKPKAKGKPKEAPTVRMVRTTVALPEEMMKALDIESARRKVSGDAARFDKGAIIVEAVRFWQQHQHQRWARKP